jgi:hypothetical protein
METDFAVMVIRERRYSMRAVVAENFLQFPVSRVMSALYGCATRTLMAIQSSACLPASRRAAGRWGASASFVVFAARTSV